MRFFENRPRLLALGCAVAALLGSSRLVSARLKPPMHAAPSGAQGRREMLRMIAAFLRQSPGSEQGNPATIPSRPAVAPDRHATERYAPLLPYRGGLDRTRAYTQYIVTQTRECRHRLNKARAERIARALLASADKQGLDPRLLAAMVQRESDFNPDETSRCGAKGLGQLTHWDDGGVDCYNVEANLSQSAKNLKSLLKRFGSPELALAAYNAGEDAVQKHHGIPPYPETRAHVRVVMGIYRNISRLRPPTSSPVRVAPGSPGVQNRLVRVAQHS